MNFNAHPDISPLKRVVMEWILDESESTIAVARYGAFFLSPYLPRRVLSTITCQCEGESFPLSIFPTPESAGPTSPTGVSSSGCPREASQLLSIQ